MLSVHIDIITLVSIVALRTELITYLGDAEVEVAREQTNPLNYYNTGLLVLLLPVWALFAIYKKIRFTVRTDYVQTLHPVILGVGGRKNISRKMIILGQLLLCLSFFAGHFLLHGD